MCPYQKKKIQIKKLLSSFFLNWNHAIGEDIDTSKLQKFLTFEQQLESLKICEEFSLFDGMQKGKLHVDGMPFEKEHKYVIEMLNSF